MNEFANRIYNFVSDQKKEWQLAGLNYQALSKVRVRNDIVRGNEVLIQFNPERLTSSSATVDKMSILNRKCFLCTDNRPEVQTEIPLTDNYNLLLNPFPIFDPHFTIALNYHRVQNLKSEINELFLMNDRLGEDFTIFYNGPECGASAPDHMHFQCCKSTILPIENEYFGKKNNSIYRENFGSDGEVNFISDGLRRYIGIEFSDSPAGEKILKNILDSLKLLDKYETEPKFNLISFKKKKNCVFVIPRVKHRPDCYYKEGDERILISPAAVDMGGILICPREEDFTKIDKEFVEKMYEEVCYPEEKFRELLDAFNCNKTDIISEV